MYVVSLPPPNSATTWSPTPGWTSRQHSATTVFVYVVSLPPPRSATTWSLALGWTSRQHSATTVFVCCLLTSTSHSATTWSLALGWRSMWLSATTVLVCRLLTSTQFCNHLTPGAGLDVSAAQCNYCMCMSSPYLHPVPQPLKAWRWVGGLSGTVQLDRFASGGDGELGTAQNLRHVDFRFERGEVHLGKGQLE